MRAGILFILAAFAFGCKNRIPENFSTRFEYSSRSNNKDVGYFYGYDNLDSALACAKKIKKNLLVIFSSGHFAACRGDD